MASGLSFGNINGEALRIRLHSLQFIAQTQHEKLGGVPSALDTITFICIYTYILLSVCLSLSLSPPLSLSPSLSRSVFYSERTLLKTQALKDLNPLNRYVDPSIKSRALWYVIVKFL